ncbi:unnamed protein product, partial [Mesorhabditis spiculigera]
MPGQPLKPMLTGALLKKPKARTAEELLGSPILMANEDMAKDEKMTVECNDLQAQKEQDKFTGKFSDFEKVDEKFTGDNETHVEEKPHNLKKLGEDNNSPNFPKTFSHLDFTPSNRGEAQKKKLLLDISLSPIVGNAKMSQADEQHPSQAQAVDLLEDLPDRVTSIELNRSMSEADFVDWIDNDDS